MKARHFLICLAFLVMAFVSCTPEEQPPTISYVFKDVSSEVGATSVVISCRNESVDDDKVFANVLLSRNENITDATKYPLHLKNDTLRGTINGLESNTMYFFCFEVYTANEHKRTDEVHHFKTSEGSNVMVSTMEAMNITQTGATLGGSVTTVGNYTVSMRGVCWDTLHDPNVLQSPHQASGEGTGTFFLNITELKPETTYYMKAYAVSDNVVYYGNELSFKTLPNVSLPTVTTGTVTDITSISAKCSGDVTADGGATVTERGICWSTSHNPTTSGSHSSSGNGTGNFTCNMTGLTENTTYYVRAYATNSAGTAYGSEVSFTPQQGVSQPTVTTSQITNITQTTATGGGNVTSDGGGTVTARGICWSTSHNPTTSGSHTTDGSGTGSFTSSMTNLTPNTTYYVRAYATNSVGTAYGSEVSFTTLSGGGGVPTGAINGLFSVSANQQVWFSQGNLQWKASTNTWKFADHQYDYVGEDNANISSSYSGWIDLFGWGTSGYDHGAVCYKPWNKNMSYSDYYAYGDYKYNLNDQTGQADWGYNPISNGGNQENQWRTLTKNEWGYVFFTRTTASGIRYAKAKVKSVNGVVLLPDDWSTSYYSLSNTNSANADFSSNIISATQWGTLEQHGAVFLPAAGYRAGNLVYSVGGYGWYWSASHSNSRYAYCVYFGVDLTPQEGDYRYYGMCVRLVQNN